MLDFVHILLTVYCTLKSDRYGYKLFAAKKKKRLNVNGICFHN
jgi:hypothetical protein